MGYKKSPLEVAQIQNSEDAKVLIQVTTELRNLNMAPFSL